VYCIRKLPACQYDHVRYMMADFNLGSVTHSGCLAECVLGLAGQLSGWYLFSSQIIGSVLAIAVLVVYGMHREWLR
jgi:hypothetical protein